MDNQSRLAQALEIQDQIFGVRWHPTAHPGEPERAAEFRRLNLEHAFADSWTTDLDVQVKSLVTIAMLTVMGVSGEYLKNHVTGALSLGITPDQLVDLFIHISSYAGIPRADAGWSAVSAVLSERTNRDRRAEQA